MMEKGLLGLSFEFLPKIKFIVGMICCLCGTVLSLFLPQVIGQLMEVSFLACLMATPSLKLASGIGHATFSECRWLVGRPETTVEYCSKFVSGT